MEELLVTSNLSFSHNVFHRYIYLVLQNVALCGIGLMALKRWNLSLIERGKNMRNGENAGYQNFLLFPLFSNGFYLNIVKTQDFEVWRYMLIYSNHTNS